MTRSKGGASPACPGGGRKASGRRHLSAADSTPSS